MTDTFETLKKIMAEKFEVDTSKVTLDSTFDDICIDSMDIFDMIFEAEDTFGIDIPNDAVDIECMRDVVELIDRFRKEGQAQ